MLIRSLVGSGITPLLLFEEFGSPCPRPEINRLRLSRSHILMDQALEVIRDALLDKPEAWIVRQSDVEIPSMDDAADMNDEAPRSEACIKSVIPEVNHLIPHGGLDHTGRILWRV